MTQRCPICRKTITRPQGNATSGKGFFPFCSLRCRLVDLGRWLDSDYRIFSEVQSQRKEQADDDAAADDS